ncbi:putative membrane protein [Clostridium sp. CAG:921]|nr:putative membrane protein [Clostridium sp. CAG:921]
MIENNENDLCDECVAKANVTSNSGPEHFEVVSEVRTQGNTYANNTNLNAKSKLAAGLFGIFLGGLGVHNFYLGYTGKAVAQLLLSLLSCGLLSWVSSIWGLIEGGGGRIFEFVLFWFVLILVLIF